MKALIVEDAPEIVETIRLCISIRWPGTTVLSTARGNDAPSIIEAESPDIVVLDLGLPDIDGLDVLKQVRTFSDVPILIVTVRGDELSRVKGLEMGADDYLVKPFSHTEFLARMWAVLRRTNRLEMGGAGGLITGKDFSIDLAARRVFVNSKEIDLAPTEWNLFSYLVRNEGKVVPQAVLAERVWGTSEVESSAIKMCVRRLRLKLGDSLQTSSVIRTHRGRGYSFVRPQ